jgi:amino-acid N-acetyltransferase
VNITTVGADELAAVTALLGANGLPTADLSPATALFGVRDASGLEGVVGIEVCGPVGLLRSLAVRADRRRGGLGSALVIEAERMATARGLEALYLLTTTAETFFARRGYVRLSRDEAPVGIRGTTEFASLCPASAAFMWKELGSSA